MLTRWPYKDSGPFTKEEMEQISKRDRSGTFLQRVERLDSIIARLMNDRLKVATKGARRP